MTTQIESPDLSDAWKVPPAAAPAYQMPAVLIRSTQTIGDVSDEITVEIATGPVDPAQIRQILRDLAERRPAAENRAISNGQEVLS